MFSICHNSRIKSSRNQKRSASVTKIKTIIKKYKWKGIKFPSEKDDWEKFEKKNSKIAINVLYAKKEKIYPT